MQWFYRFLLRGQILLSGYPLNETRKEIIHLKKGNITGINDHKGGISKPTWKYVETLGFMESNSNKNYSLPS